MMNKKLFIQIQGMTCPNCEKIVTQALEELPGISEVVVNKDENRGNLEADLPYNPLKLSAIEEAVYSVRSLKMRIPYFTKFKPRTSPQQQLVLCYHQNNASMIIPKDLLQNSINNESPFPFPECTVHLALPLLNGH